jgi:hypothetical protein
MASPLDPQGKDREGLPASRLVRVVLHPVALRPPMVVLADHRPPVALADHLRPVGPADHLRPVGPADHRPVGRADLHLPADHRLPAALADLVDHLLPAAPAGRRSTVPAIRSAGHPARASCR